MKIVDVAEFYAERGGGVKTYINQKLAAAAAAGHEMVVIAPGPEDREEDRLGGRILWVKGPPLPPDPRYYVLYRERAVHQLLDREAPDVVEGSSPWSGGWFAARWKGDALKTFIFHADPVAVYPQTFFGARLGHARVDRMFAFYWAYLRRLSGNFDATIVSGKWLAEKLQGFGIKSAIPVPFGIDKSRFSPAKRDVSMRAQMLESCGLDEDGQLLLTISRFHPEKRLGTLFKAFEKVASQRKLGLVVYGDGPLKKYHGKRAAKIPGIHLAGFSKDREELARALASSDAMLHGSSAETYGLVVAEAICSGLPVIVPDRGGAADLADPRYAEIYAAGDVEDCAAAIERMLLRDPVELQRSCATVGEGKIGTMADHFSQLFRCYEKLVLEKKKA